MKSYERKHLHIKNFMAPFFMDGVQLPQGYTATSRRQFTFYHSVPRNFWYSFYRPRKDERLGQPWSHPVVLNTGPLDWQSSTLITRSLLHKLLATAEINLPSESLTVIHESCRAKLGKNQNYLFRIH